MKVIDLGVGTVLTAAVLLNQTTPVTAKVSPIGDFAEPRTRVASEPARGTRDRQTIHPIDIDWWKVDTTSAVHERQTFFQRTRPSERFLGYLGWASLTDALRELSPLGSEINEQQRIVNWLISDVNLTQKQIGELLGVHRYSVHRWLNESGDIRQRHLQRLVEIESILRTAARLYPSVGQRNAWLFRHSPKAGTTPFNLLQNEEYALARELASAKASKGLAPLPEWMTEELALEPVDPSGSHELIFMTEDELIPPGNRSGVQE